MTDYGQDNSQRQNTITGLNKIDPMRLSNSLSQRLTTMPMGRAETDTISRVNNDLIASTIALKKLEHKKFIGKTEIKPKETEK